MAPYARPDPQNSLRQCEIVSNLVQHFIDPLSVTANGGERVILEQAHEFAVILTQDCDLTWDFDARQKGVLTGRSLGSILFCEALDTRHIDRSKLNAKLVPQNKDERYHFLEKSPPDNDLLETGIPEILIDFQRIFTVPADEVYAQLASDILKRRTMLESPYKEHLSLRAMRYHSRIGLPKDHLSDK